MIEPFHIIALTSSVLLAAVAVGTHLLVDFWIRRAAIRRLHAIQDEMGRLCKRGASEETNRKVDALAHEAAGHLARFGIDYWAVVDQQR